MTLKTSKFPEGVYLKTTLDGPYLGPPFFLTGCITLASLIYYYVTLYSLIKLEKWFPLQGE